MKRLIPAIVAAMLALAGTEARAQDVDQARADAQAFNKDGVALLAKKDFAGALDKFQRAYAAFASPKVLLNVAAALKELGRTADAANVYQKYLDDPGSDSARRVEVAKILAALEASTGVMAITVEPAYAEVQIDVAPPGWLLDQGAWLPAKEVAVWRVPPGTVVVRARKFGYKDGEETVTVDDAVKKTVALTLAAEEKAADPVVAEVPVVETPPEVPEGGITERPEPAPVKSVQLGAVLDVSIDGKWKGGAVSPGVVVRLAGRLDIVAKAQVSGSKGAYLGASFALTRGKVRPTLAAGLPIFFDDGARVGARGAAGLSFELGRVSVIAEAGGEYFFNPGMDFVSFVFVPVLGVRGRL